jgi:ABC-type Fe3+-hydroxamate transport system substrate-binding protein
MKKHLALVFLMSVMLMGGCATIVGEKTQVVPISSSPSEATILITDEKGEQVFKGLTPTSVTLQKSDGSYWGKKTFTVNITKKGYEPQVIPITAEANEWYLFGNIVFGGLIGWFIVDPFNGAMYTLSPEQISATLGQKMAHNNMASDGSIYIMLIQDVPLSLRDKMRKIN